VLNEPPRNTRRVIYQVAPQRKLTLHIEYTPKTRRIDSLREIILG